jgi:hypothetical protein
MYWEVEIPIIVRNLINDLDASPTYSDDRINQLAVVAARYVLGEVNLDTEYNIDIVNTTMVPDPSDPSSRDTDFVGFVALKAACLLDQSTFRTKAVNEGISASLGPARLSVGGNLSGFKTILEMGPCGTYEQLVMDHNIGNISTVRAILSPFVGNNFDPRYLMRSNLRGRDFY